MYTAYVGSCLHLNEWKPTRLLDVGDGCADALFPITRKLWPTITAVDEKLTILTAAKLSGAVGWRFT